MIPSFLFLLYLLSNTVLFGTDASAGERGKVTMMRREYIAQPSFLPAVDSPLWDVFIPAKRALSVLSKRKPRVHKCAHTHRGIYTPIV